MNRTGARWSLQGAEAVLQLRSLVKSGDFDEYWIFHEAREHERNHLDAYADRRLPQVHKPARRPSLPAQSQVDRLALTPQAWVPLQVSLFQKSRTHLPVG